MWGGGGGEGGLLGGRLYTHRYTVTTSNCDCYIEKGSAKKPAHAHLRRFNIIHNDVDIILIMYF